MARGCESCSLYVDCRRRINAMKNVKKTCPSNSREDIRARLSLMEYIAANCPDYFGGD
jgi:hypothetical protein